MASPLVRWLAGRSPHDLAAILARRRDVLDGGKPPSDLAALATRLQAQGSVTAALAGLPRPAAQLVEAMQALGGPTVRRERLATAVGRAADDPELAATLEVLAQRALVWPAGDDLRMAGQLWSAFTHPLKLGGSFEPQPPQVALVDADPVAVEREAAAAAIAAVERVTALLNAIDATPVALIKAGGVGSRELRRLARSVDCGEPEVRLWLELAYSAGLAGVISGQVLPTGAYDEWRAAEPAVRLPVLLQAWPHLSAAPLLERGLDGGPVPPALLRDTMCLAAVDLRAAFLRILSELPDGVGLADLAGMTAVLRWQVPVLAEPAQGVLASLWREAHLVGAVACGTLTPLGRVLLSAPSTIGEVARKLLPPPVTEAVFQNDLTAMVPGIPTGALAGLLDSVAERESRGTATTWRFSAASVRAALDAGHEPAELLASLRAAAVGRTLPQVLEYLVTDVGRQHGLVRIRAVGCVLRAEDPALITEIARARALRPLALAVLAPTVLASAKPAAETLAALRAAGYAPVREDADGQPRIERVPRRRAPARRPGRASSAGRSLAVAGARADGVAGGTGRATADPVDLVALAGRLLATAAAEPSPEDRLADVVPLRPRAGGSVDATRLTSAARYQTRDASATAAPSLTAVAEAVDLHAAHLNVAERRRLTVAIVRGADIKISYRDAAGDFSTRVVEPITVERHLLVAWCHLRDDERAFALDRIEAVFPA